MRRISVLLFLGLAIAGFVFAEDAKNSELYTKTSLGYNLSGSVMDPLSIGNFSFSKVRVGLKTNLAERLSLLTEVDLRYGELRLALFEITPIDNLTFTGGKIFKNFASQEWAYGGGRYLGLGAKYNFGIGYVSAQIGSEVDYK